MRNCEKQNFKILRNIVFFGFLMSLLFSGPMEVKGTACPDPMGPIGGDITISEDCKFTGTVVGADGGGIIINENINLLVDADQTLVFAPGSRIVKNGHFIWNTGAKIIKGYIWLTDQDNDGYPTTSTPIAQLASTTSSQYRRSAQKFIDLFATVSDISYDAVDTDPLIFPGTTCGTPCSENSILGLCVPVAATCLSTCQRCSISTTEPVNIDPGYVCTGLGIPTAVTSSDYCTSSAFSAANVNNCQYTASGTNYYGCNGTGSGCEATVRATTGGSTTTCPANQATKDTTSCTAASTSNYCTSSAFGVANVNNCQYTASGTNYYGCNSNGLNCETTVRATTGGATTTCASNQATRNTTACAVVTASNYCNTTSTSAANVNVCQYTAAGNSYTGCTGSGTTCGAAQLIVPGATTTCTAGYAAGSTTTCATVTSSIYCQALTNACDGACEKRTNYYGCANSGSSCEGTSRATTDAYLSTAGKVCSGGSEVAASSGTNCRATINCVTNACSATKYYEGCAAGSASCTATSKVAGTAWNSTNGYVVNETNYKAGTTCTEITPTATYKCSTSGPTCSNTCSAVTYYRACGGSGSCRTDNTGAASATTNCTANQYCSGSACTSGQCTSHYYCSSGTCTNGGSACMVYTSCTNGCAVSTGYTNSACSVAATNYTCPNAGYGNCYVYP